MKHPRDGMDSARQARRSLGLVRQKLLNPTPKALQASTPHLEFAIAALEQLRNGGTATDMTEFCRELAQVKALMQHAAEFHACTWNLLFPPEDQSVNYAA